MANGAHSNCFGAINHYHYNVGSLVLNYHCALGNDNLTKTIRFFELNNCNH